MIFDVIILISVLSWTWSDWLDSRRKIWNSSRWWHGLYGIGETNADSKSLVSPPEKIFKAAQNLLIHFRAKLSCIPRPSRLVCWRWKPPASDIYKTNYGGATFTQIGEAGIGIVVWNERGKVMASLVEKKFPCLQVWKFQRL